MSIRFLINPDGSPFGNSELQILNSKLDSLADSDRVQYRNQNATAIAQSNAPNFLIVSGPGTGKSHLFLQKINHWFQQDPDTKIAVTSFVRKLVEDLKGDIGRANNLTDTQKNNITVSTLHRFARSIVEKNKGTKNWPFKSNIQVIVGFWEEIFWNDVIAFHQGIDHSLYSWKEFKPQLDKNFFLSSGEWPSILKTYSKLCQFYNACSFADSILRARQALEENPGLNEVNHFIIDEYQDFNPAEEALVKQLVINAKNILVVGDDEQVLYELKSSSPDLIRILYRSPDHINGILPFCGRCGYHITKCASHFIQQYKGPDSIEKIYLPLGNSLNDPKVQIVACAASSTAVDYIGKFVDDHKSEIDIRKGKLESGKEKEAFLMILTPTREMKFYRPNVENLKKIVTPYQSEIRSFSENYYVLLNYYYLAKNLQDNFTFRKILHDRKIPIDRVHSLVKYALDKGKNLCELNEPEIKLAIDIAQKIKPILEFPNLTLTPQALDQIASLIRIDKKTLQADIEYECALHNNMGCLECIREGGTEVERIQVKQMNAVELMTIVGSKGLSADHVIIIGFDDRSMKHITENAFYVAMTRARKSLHIITAMRSGGASQAHSFLDQLPDDHIEFHKYTKTGHCKAPLQGRAGFENYLRTLQRRKKTS